MSSSKDSSPLTTGEKYRKIQIKKLNHQDSNQSSCRKIIYILKIIFHDKKKKQKPRKVEIVSLN